MTKQTSESDIALPVQWQDLVRASRSARAAAYAPYSKYSVGAAVLLDDGRVFSGCNVENASFGLTICAERVAATSAIATGGRDIAAVCISLTGTPVPCGACRQFLYEFNPQMVVLLDDLSSASEALEADTAPEVTRLDMLLPRGFRLT